MARMTLDDLRRVLVEAGGAAEDHALAGAIDDVPFETLGYDSLALVEAAARIAKEFVVTIPDERVFDLRTPREVLDEVNGGQAGAPR